MARSLPTLDSILKELLDVPEVMSPFEESTPEESTELTAAVDSITDAPSTSKPSTVRSAPEESSDEETRVFILKNDGFKPKPSSVSGTPRVRLRKTPRLRNAPQCSHRFKKGTRKGEICGALCRLGDDLCAKHQRKDKDVKPPPSQTSDFEAMATKVKFRRLKVSKQYQLLKSNGPTAILSDCGRVLKVRLPNCLMPIPKTGSLLKFETTGQGNKRPMWGCV